MKRAKELAPCGVYCGACPSYNKTCLGCPSDDHGQNRCSKWSCKIRNCCYNQKGLDYCAYCEHFPCRIIHKKLLANHAGDPAYDYRFEIPDIFIKLKTMGLNKFLDFQRERWKCASCGGTLLFYHYRCNQCGKER